VSIQEQIGADMASSMKAAEPDRTGVLRLLRSAIKNEEIKTGHSLIDDEVLKVLKREAKQRRDSIVAYDAAARADLAAHEAMELAIIQTYLPEPLKTEELIDIIDQVIKDQGASGMAAMGSVIGAVVARTGARSEGAIVSKLVRERLSI
jgi:uncharacterized protein YqeY